LLRLFLNKDQITPEKCLFLSNTTSIKPLSEANFSTVQTIRRLAGDEQRFIRKSFFTDEATYKQVNYCASSVEAGKGSAFQGVATTTDKEIRVGVVASLA
jgi:hypothetical protein